MRLPAGDELKVALGGRTGAVDVGVRPEKLRLGQAREGENSLSGTVKETAYVGVATQYVVETGAGNLMVYAQNTDGSPALRPGDVVQLSWAPDSTFVLDPDKEAA